jgi:predicted RNase H-like nuclease (RuvC/YqgF family)
MSSALWRLDELLNTISSAANTSWTHVVVEHCRALSTFVREEILLLQTLNQSVQLLTRCQSEPSTFIDEFGAHVTKGRDALRILSHVQAFVEILLKENSHLSQQLSLQQDQIIMLKRENRALRNEAQISSYFLADQQRKVDSLLEYIQSLQLENDEK